MAAPNPEKELGRLGSALSKEPPGVVVLQGPARWFKDRALDAVRKVLAEHSEITELDGLESSGGAAEAGNFLMDLRTASLFGGRRVLLLRNGDRWLRQHAASLVQTVEKVAAGNTLVVEVGKLDGRTQLAKTIKKMGEVFEFRALYDKSFGAERRDAGAELVRWLLGRARTRGLNFDDDAALFMVEVVGTDPAQLDGELSRLSAQIGGQRVTAAALRGALTISFGSSQFELVDAILAGDPVEALRSLRAMYREGLRDRDGKRIEQTAVFPIVTSWMRTSIGKLLEARAALNAGASPASVVEQHGGWFKDRFARQLDRLSTTALVDLLGALHRAERRLRTSSETPEVLLERLLAETLLPIRQHLAVL